MLSDLAGCRLPNVDIGKLGPVRSRNPIFRFRRCGQHRSPPLSEGSEVASSGAAFGLIALPPGSGPGSAGPAQTVGLPSRSGELPDATHAVESRLDDRASRITSAVVAVANLSLKYRTNGTSVRTETADGRKSTSAMSFPAGTPRLVDDLRTVRRRPSGRRKTR